MPWRLQPHAYAARRRCELPQKNLVLGVTASPTAPRVK